MLINEIFDSTVQVDWSADRSTAIGKFTVEDENYKIRIEAGTYEFNQKTYNIANVGFLKSKGEIDSLELTGNNKNSAKVLGAVINGVSSKIHEYDLDAIIFMAADHAEKRMKIYNWIARKFNKGSFPKIIENVKLPAGGMMTVLLSKQIPDEAWNDFKEYLIKRKKFQ
jgi:hypothetical protein